MRPARFRRLLCPTDFSKPAERAVRLASALAAPGATIHLMHVWHVMTGISAMPVFLPPANPKQGLAAVNRVLRRLERLDRRLGVGRGRRVEYHARVGPDAASLIVRLARELGVDAIVLATHARRGLERLLLGSVASAVARQSPVPVILVHPGRSTRAGGGADGTRFAPLARARRGS